MRSLRADDASYDDDNDVSTMPKEQEGPKASQRNEVSCPLPDNDAVMKDTVEPCERGCQRSAAALPGV
jgi:hypothetical protein